MKKQVVITALILSSMFIAMSLSARIMVVSTEGDAAFRDERTGTWVQLQPGRELQEGVRLSTGVKSSITLNLSGNKVMVGPLTMMQVYQNQLVSGTQQTQINMRRGEMVADVTEGQRVKTVFRVATPVVTSSVRGTTQRVETGPTGTLVRATEGSVRVDSRNGQARVLSGRLAFDMPKGAMEPRPVLQSSVPNIAPTGSTEREQMAADLFTDQPQGADIQIDRVNMERFGVDITNITIKYSNK